MAENHEAIIFRQELTYAVIKLALEKFQALDLESSSTAQIQTRLSTLDSNWNQFKGDHQKLTRARLSDETKQNKYFTGNMFGNCEEMYVNARSLMLTTLEELRVNNSADTSLNQSSVQHSSHLRSLPKITLPKFAGDYQNWRPFHDLYTL